MHLENQTGWITTVLPVLLVSDWIFIEDCPSYTGIQPNPSDYPADSLGDWCAIAFQLAIPAVVTSLVTWPAPAGKSSHNGRKIWNLRCVFGTALSSCWANVIIFWWILSKKGHILKILYRYEKMRSISIYLRIFILYLWLPFISSNTYQ